MNHVFESGTWFAVSSDQSAAASDWSALLPILFATLRLSSPRPGCQHREIQRGDSLASFLARHC